VADAMSKPPVPPASHGFQRLLPVRKVGDSGLIHSIEATAQECERIAAFLDILLVGDVRAEFRVSRWRSHS